MSVLGGNPKLTKVGDEWFQQCIWTGVMMKTRYGIPRNGKRLGAFHDPCCALAWLESELKKGRIAKVKHDQLKTAILDDFKPIAVAPAPELDPAKPDWNTYEWPVKPDELVSVDQDLETIAANRRRHTSNKKAAAAAAPVSSKSSSSSLSIIQPSSSSSSSSSPSSSPSSSSNGGDRVMNVFRIKDNGEEADKWAIKEGTSTEIGRMECVAYTTRRSKDAVLIGKKKTLQSEPANKRVLGIFSAAQVPVMFTGDVLLIERAPGESISMNPIRPHSTSSTPKGERKRKTPSNDDDGKAEAVESPDAEQGSPETGGRSDQRRRRQS